MKRKMELSRISSKFKKYLGFAPKDNNERSLELISYLSYGDDSKVRALGRVVKKKPQSNFSKQQKSLEHFITVLKLFLTKKVDCAPLTYNNKEKTIHFNSNAEGYFSHIVPVTRNNDVAISLGTKKAVIEFLAPSLKTKKIIISDIDDTIMKSKAISMTSLVVKTLFYPLKKREAFSEAAEIYHDLQLGPGGDEENMIFYVSSSTWSLYPMLMSFIKKNNFPKGPLLLQDIKTEKQREGAISHAHKLDRIIELVEFYPHLKFQLIGDAGQRDAQIYLEIAKRYPQKIDYILIRHTWWSKELKTYTEFLEQAKRLGIKMVYFSDLNEALVQIEKL